MIGRYEVPEIQALWSEESKFRTWLEVELAVCGVWKERGVIPTHAYEDIRSRASFDIRRIDEIEQEVQHDMIAFVSSVAETVGENGR